MALRAIQQTERHPVAHVPKLDGSYYKSAAAASGTGGGQKAVGAKQQEVNGNGGYVGGQSQSVISNSRAHRVVNAYAADAFSPALAKRIDQRMDESLMGPA